VRGLLVIGAMVLVVYALLDCLRRPGDQVRGLPKVAWVAVILLLPVIGALAWLLAGRGRGPAGPPRRPERPVAPDDDPDFLWRLEQERRRREKRDP
jgi:hypothetical protein